MKAVNDAHELEYGKIPDVVAKAPGRFHLIGEHSWFFKDKTLSMAVNLPVYVAVSKRDEIGMRFYFHQLNERRKSSASVKFKKEDKWANALKAVIYGFSSGGYSVDGIDFTIYSQILPSAGFGITTAIKVAAALAIKELLNLNCSDGALLQVLERANKLFLQSTNHIADNFTALFSKKSNLLITDHFKNTWDYANFDFPDKKILLVDTKVPRWTVWNEDTIFEPQYALLLGDLREKKPNVFGGWQYISDITDINGVFEVVSENIHRKLYTMLKEHNDVLEAREGLIKSDFFRFARAINDSYTTMRDLYDISCPEIDWILKRVAELEPNLEQVRNPVTCGRITGKGFGRCLFAVVRNSDVQKFNEKIVEFEKIFGFHPDVYEVVPSDGASIVRD